MLKKTAFSTPFGHYQYKRLPVDLGGAPACYRRFIPKFNHIAKPLNDVLKKDVTFNCNSAQQLVFEELKDTLMNGITAKRKT